MLGQELAVQSAYNDISSEYEVYLLFKSAGIAMHSDQIYLFRSETGVSGKIPIIRQ